jgi:hypothetical protein
MACRAVHFAITCTDANRLLAASSPDEVLRIIQEDIEEKWDEEWLYQSDKAWDAIHRCLSDGTLNPTTGVYPRKLAILNGRQISAGEHYIVSLVTPQEAKDIASNLASIDQASLLDRYEAIDPDDYSLAKSREDFEYTREYFEDLGAFFQKAAEADRYVIFTVDQ